MLALIANLDILVAMKAADCWLAVEKCARAHLAITATPAVNLKQGLLQCY